jgi:acetyl esterase/lipase
MFGKGYKRSIFFPHADFTANISEKMPPSFVVTSYADFLRKIVLKGYQKMKEKNVECELLYFDKPTETQNVLGHVFNVSQPWYPESVKVNKAMTDFFKKYIN